VYSLIDTLTKYWREIYDFVSNSRSGKYEGKTFDFIFGSVANDDVYTTFTLKIKKLYNQLVLTSEKAFSYLKFIGTVPEEKF